MKTFLRIAGAVAIATTCSQAFAETNSPNPEQTNTTGSSTISMTIPPLVMVTGIEDLPFGTLTDSDGIVTGVATELFDDDTVCVYSNQNDFTYDVDLVGNGAGSTFRITHTTDATDFIPYRVYWNQATGSRGSPALSDGGTTAGLDDRVGSNQYDCGGSDNARFDIEFDRDDILDVREGEYEGILTITISVPT